MQVNLEEVVQLIKERITWDPDAAREFRALPDEMKLDVLQQLARMAINPRVGQELENKHGFNLEGYRKMYFWKATYRIIYRIEDDGKCKVWGIGPRLGLAVYRKVSSRIPDDD